MFVICWVKNRVIDQVRLIGRIELWVSRSQIFIATTPLKSKYIITFNFKIYNYSGYIRELLWITNQLFSSTCVCMLNVNIN